MRPFGSSEVSIAVESSVSASPGGGNYTHMAVEPHTVIVTKQGGPESTRPELEIQEFSQDVQQLLLPIPRSVVITQKVSQQRKYVPLEREASPQLFVRDIPHQRGSAPTEEQGETYRSHPPPIWLPVYFCSADGIYEPQPTAPFVTSEQIKSNKSKHQYENLSLGTSFPDLVVPISTSTMLLPLFGDFLPLWDFDFATSGGVALGVLLPAS